VELVIGDKYLSSWSLRAWLAMKRTGVPFTERLVGLNPHGLTPGLGDVSPSARVPILNVDGELIWDSLAICEYLADRFPQAQLWPADPMRRAIARSAACEMHSGFPSLRGEFSMNLKVRVESDVSELTANELRRLAQLFTTLRTRFAKDGPFLVGPWSIADAFYTPVATRLRSYGLRLSDYGDAGIAGEYASALLQQPDFLEWEAAAMKEEVAA
jgi:glutathione S-transferase